MKKKCIRKNIICLLCLLLVLANLNLIGCGENLEPNSSNNTNTTTDNDNLTNKADQSDWFDSIPDYRGTPYIEVNSDIPFFSDKDKSNTDSFERYSNLDELGRCGIAYANVCEEIMPTEEREDSLSSVTLSGWCQNQYDGEYLLNRCHLIGYQLAGENANEKNLIAGTRYFNVDGMLPFENTVAEYIDDNPNNHVLYRVTPIYQNEKDLMACGVLMEAWSVEDNGYGCQFCVYVYNVQPGIEIDYSTGENWKGENKVSDDKYSDIEENIEYILNSNSKKFHTKDCSNASRISDNNREIYMGSRDKLTSQGYDPAGCCNP